MAFSFGASPSSTPSLFGGTSKPAFGSASLFGNSTPAFGASSTPSLFGGLSSSGFGTSSTPSLFGGGLSSASSAPSLFASASAFGSSQPAGGFNFNSSPSLFGSSSAFGQSQAGFGFGQQSTASFGAQPQAGAQGGIATTDNKPITHYTRWEEIAPAGQNQLLQMEKRLSDMKEECRQLDQCARLHDLQPDHPGSAEAALRHNLKGLASTWLGDEEAIIALKERVHSLLHATETAVRTFQRSFQWREVTKANQGQVISPAVREMLSAPVTLPSHYLQECVSGFQKTVEQYFGMVSELEKLLPVSAGRQDAHPQLNDADTFLKSIPSAIRNIQDLLLHTAAKIDALNERVSTARDLHVDRLRAEGNYLDPFQDAERRQRQRDTEAQNRTSIIPPVQAQWGTGPQNSNQSQLQLTSVASPLIGGGAILASSFPSLVTNNVSGGGVFGDSGQQQKSALSRKTKSKK